MSKKKTDKTCSWEICCGFKYLFFTGSRFERQNEIGRPRICASSAICRQSWSLVRAVALIGRGRSKYDRQHSTSSLRCWCSTVDCDNIMADDRCHSDISGRPSQRRRSCPSAVSSTLRIVSNRRNNVRYLHEYYNILMQYRNNNMSRWRLRDFRLVVLLNS